MGTDSITRVVDVDGTLVAAFHKWCDSHPDVYGEALATFLSSACNGQEHAGGTFNGMGDLAAQLLAHFKSSNTESSGSAWGHIYMIPPQLALDNVYDAELGYTVSPYFDRAVRSQPLEYRMRYPYKLALDVKDGQMGEVLFRGPVAMFDPEEADRRWCALHEED